MKAAIIGVGLIGGSMALAFKEKGLASKLIGVDNNADHARQALLSGLVDEMLSLEEAISVADVIILAVPVNAAIQLLPVILDKVENAVVMDVGSTKEGILKSIKHHAKKDRYVATHPMWGTEYSGPEAAVKGAFVNKATVICNKEDVAQDALYTVENIYRRLGMHIIYMTAQDHDVHVAYVSHISHITSFALANTVLEKEREEDTIFELASGGFESTVRLAKSNPSMWAPIFMENRENVLDVLNEHISQLRKFKACLEKENYVYLKQLIEQANTIKRIIK